MSNLIIKIPLKSLQLPASPMVGGESESEEGELPMVNDPVSFHAEGVVTGISGDNATVSISFINGERPGESESDEPDKGDEEKAPTDEELEKAANKADEESNY
jgi:hypothetical protein